MMRAFKSISCFKTVSFKTQARKFLEASMLPFPFIQGSSTFTCEDLELKRRLHLNKGVLHNHDVNCSFFNKTVLGPYHPVWPQLPSLAELSQIQLNCVSPQKEALKRKPYQVRSFGLLFQSIHVSTFIQMSSLGWQRKM